jgi:hypothetical protein
MRELHSEGCVGQPDRGAVDLRAREVRPTKLCCSATATKADFQEQDAEFDKYAARFGTRAAPGPAADLSTFRIKGSKHLVRKNKIGIERYRRFALEKNLIGMASV